jgi:prepilin-type N-terminal cleavage/methylation domain-containing protein/prepilin-type processing-associated H-X9-DG protein
MQFVVIMLGARPARRNGLPRRGFTLIEILVVVAIIGVLVALLMPAINSARESARRTSCADNLRQIGLATQNYVDAHQMYPSGRTNGVAGSGQNWSPLAGILPFIEGQMVYELLNFDFIPGHDANDTARKIDVNTYLCPSDAVGAYRPQGVKNANSNYRACAGSDWTVDETNDGVFPDATFTRIAEVTDGTSKTVLYSERVLGDGDDNRVDRLADVYKIARSNKTRDDVYKACSSVRIGSPATLGSENQSSNAGRQWLNGQMFTTRYMHVMPPNAPSCARPKAAGGDLDSSINGQGGAMTANSRHPGGVNVVLADGSVQRVQDAVDLAIWRALATKSNGEIVKDF